MKLLVKNNKRLQLILVLIAISTMGAIKYFSENTMVSTFFKNRVAQVPSPSPQPQGTPNPWRIVAGNKVNFNTQIYLKRDRTFISLPLYFEKDLDIAWLSIKSAPSGEPNNWLISHPQLKNLEWSFIKEGSVYLYQKSPTYKNLNDFLKPTQTNRKVLIDESVRLLPKYKDLSATQLARNTHKDDFDYILTTYKQCFQQGSHIEYNNIFDLSHAHVDGQQNLNWIIQTEAEIDNPMYIGNINVEYYQYDPNKQK